MLYETEPVRTVRIKCTLEEYRSKKLRDYFKCALRSRADKVVIEISNNAK